MVSSFDTKGVGVGCQHQDVSAPGFVQFQLPATSYQLSAISCQLLSVGCQPPIANRQPPFAALQRLFY